MHCLIQGQSKVSILIPGKVSVPSDREVNRPASPKTDIATLAIITVTYHPDIDVLDAQLESLPTSALIVVVDNASTYSEREALRLLCGARTRCFLVENDTNFGLPAAINQGVRHAISISPDCRYLLFLDQDTEPDEEGVLSLLRCFESLRATDRNLGCVGPRLLDAKSGLGHGFHRIAGWRWERCYPEADSFPVECANLNCSGSLMDVNLFTQLGGFEEDFFMDHLDTEWSFRVLAAGYKLYGIPSVAFRHRMGAATWRFWFLGWRIWPYRAPSRHYFLFRNAIRLMRRSYVPSVWKFWAAIKLGLTALVHLLMDEKRWLQLRYMAKGVLDGLR